MLIINNYNYFVSLCYSINLIPLKYDNILIYLLMNSVMYTYYTILKKKNKNLVKNLNIRLENFPKFKLSLCPPHCLCFTLKTIEKTLLLLQTRHYI